MICPGCNATMPERVRMMCRACGRTDKPIGTDSYPAQGKEETSRAAYQSVDDVRGRRRKEVYTVIVQMAEEGQYGATQDEVGARLDRPPNSVWPRFKELEADGIIHKGERRRTTRAGRAAIVWEPTPPETVEQKQGVLM